jgi:3-oxoacyl-[acyl-carrier protein] reductase
MDESKANAPEFQHVLLVGASGALGSAICVELLSSGFRVTGTYLNNSSRLAAFEPTPMFHALPFDVSAPSECRTVVAKAEERMGPIHCLVYAAGLLRDKMTVAMTDEDWDRVLDVNLSGAFRITRALVNSMMVRNGGAIVYVGSVSGLVGVPGQINYGAAKAGLVGMAKTLAVELGAYGISCNVVAPGPLSSGMTDSLPEASRRALLRRIPRQEFGRVSTVAHVTRLLLSAEGRYISGQVIAVDGGMVSF